MTDELLQLAKERFKQAQDADSENRDRAITDLEFAAGEQWPDQVKRDRESEFRPCLTINRIPAYVRQVVNDIRQTRPAIKCRPVDSQSDPKTAKVLNGLIKAIEADSSAETAYDWAVEYAIKAGVGYIRIATEYVDSDSFDLAIKIKRVENPFSVYLDPECQEFDGSDARYAFIVDSISRDDFKETYPDAECASWDADDTRWDKDWLDGDRVLLAEYWCIEEDDATLYEMPDGQALILDDEPEYYIRKRQTTKKSVVQRIINGVEVLSESKWDWDYIPIIPVYGNVINIDGKVIRTGMVHDLIDTQRQYNYVRSASVEQAALAPLAPWIGEEGTFQSPKWQAANRKPYAFLEYKSGKPPPQRMPSGALSPVLVQEIQHAENEFRAVTGIYDTRLGAQSNEISGVAIDSRKKQSDISNFHFLDNLARAMRHVGRILVNIIPTVYAGPRVVRILGEQGEEMNVPVNQQGIMQGQQVHFDLTTGRYDIAVDVGPSYATQREEAVNQMLEMMRVMPQAAPIIGDLIAKNLDWPGAEEVAKRLKLMLPPPIAAGENPQIAQMQQQFQMEKQQMQQSIQQGMEYIRNLEAQMQRMQVEMANKERDLQIKAGELQRKMMKDQADYAVDMTKMEIDSRKNIPGAVI